MQGNDLDTLTIYVVKIGKSIRLVTNTVPHDTFFSVIVGQYIVTTRRCIFIVRCLQNLVHYYSPLEQSFPEATFHLCLDDRAFIAFFHHSPSAAAILCYPISKLKALEYLSKVFRSTSEKSLISIESARYQLWLGYTMLIVFGEFQGKLTPAFLERLMQISWKTIRSGLDRTGRDQSRKSARCDHVRALRHT